jgi:hypothetical protein
MLEYFMRIWRLRRDLHRGFARDLGLATDYFETKLDEPTRGLGFPIYPHGGVSDMSVVNVRPEANPLFAFTLMIVGAFAAGMPMAVAIIWVCS